MRHTIMQTSRAMANERIRTLFQEMYVMFVDDYHLAKRKCSEGIQTGSYSATEDENGNRKPRRKRY